MNQQRVKLIDSYNDVIANGIFYGLIMGTNLPPWNRSVNYNTLNTVYFYNWSGEKFISPYIKKLFKYYDVDKCDDQITGQTPPYTLTNNVINQHLKDIYFKKWSELWATLSYTYNPISNYDMTETETGETHNTTINTRTGNTNNIITDSTAHTGTIKNESENIGNTEFTPIGEEELREDINGGESEILFKTGKETDKTTYGGTETLDKNGSRNTSRTFTPQGQETESNTTQNTITNLTNDNKIFAFNTTQSPTSQNQNVQNGTTNTTGNTTKSFVNRIDTETLNETFTNYSESKGFTNRIDETEKTFTNRTDTKDLTYTNRYNINTKSFDNRKDITTVQDNNTNTETFNDTITKNGSNTETSSLNDNGTLNGTNSRTLTRSGNIGVTTTQQMIQQQRELLLWDYFYKVVFPDIDKILTLSIY